MGVEMQIRIYGEFHGRDGMYGHTKSAILAMSREQKIAMIVEWFHAHYEDPANSVSYNGREGGYLWGDKGPYYAGEQIYEEFGEVVDEDIVNEAVEEIEREGNDEWAAIYGSSDHGYTETEVRKIVVNRLEKFENCVQKLILPQSMKGHNQPPGTLKVEIPVSQEEWEESIDFSVNISIIRPQTELQIPDVAILSKQLQEVNAKCDKLTDTLNALIDKQDKTRMEKAQETVVFGFLKGASITLGEYAMVIFIDNLPDIIDALGNLIHAMYIWINIIGV